MDFQKKYDIVIAGGGVAGVSAALEAARAGYRTALVEKTIWLGGLATSGLIYIYLPLCDGNGKQVVFGIAEELLQLSMKYGPGTIPPGWEKDDSRERKSRYTVRFSSAAFVLALDEVLRTAGADLWLDTLACLPVMEGKRVTGLEVENKSGRGLLAAHCFIDATGDADISYRAGATCIEGDNWLSIWSHQISKEKLTEALNSMDADDLFKATSLRLGANDSGIGHPENLPKFKGTTGRQVTEFILAGRDMLRDHYQKQAVNRKDLFPLTLPSMAQFRTTRRVEGIESITDGQNNIHRPTSIGLTGDWRKAGPIWEIPYGALVPRGITGLLTAGRCIDSGGDAWHVTRVIPPAALTGQAAGAAACLSVLNNKTPDQISSLEVQGVLQKRGIPFHIEDL